MALDLAALGTATTAASALSGLILVTPQDVGLQPQNPQGDNGKQAKSFFFNYRGEDIVELNSDITDHYVEDNSAIADQIALRPEEVRTQGFIGEVTDIPPNRALEIARLASEKLTLISGYTPSLSATALRAYNLSFQAYQTFEITKNSAVQTWDTINGSSGVNIISGSETPGEIADLRNKTRNQNKQQVAFQQFYGYWRLRRLFTVQTPWAVFKNMAIKSIRATQDSETEEVSSFDITFKVIRFASTEVTEGSTNLNSTNMQGRSGIDAATEVDNGVSTPRSIEESFLSTTGVA